MLVCTVYVMLALYSYCGQKLLYADFANKIYHIISLLANDSSELKLANAHVAIKTHNHIGT